MRFLGGIFYPIKAIFGFINQYFKTCVFLLVVFLIALNAQSEVEPNLVEIKLKGAIIDEEQILKEINEVKMDNNIKGVLLSVDSPGGALAPSVAISDAVRELAAKKPTIAYALGTMASGSYYSAIWANKIYANRGSFIGSIGVIMQGVDFSELGKKIGLNEQVIKAGLYKEAGTFTRAWNKQEREFLQSLINKSYEMFYTDVAKARNLDINKISKWADAQVFLGDEAVNVGLIDGIRTYDEVKKEIQLLADVKDPVWKEKSAIDSFVSNLAKQTSNLLFSAFFSTKVW